MNAEVFRDRLVATSKQLGWSTEVVPDFVRPRFRGRDDDSAAPLAEAYGLRLGNYPVIVAPIVLGTLENMNATLRRLHTQVVIARSRMSPDEVINAHLMLCAVNPPTPAAADDPALGDWRAVVDVTQRDETVCRKIVWVPDREAIEESYRALVARTFLAMPWRTSAEVHDAALDRNHGVLERALVDAGLNRSGAVGWLKAIDREGYDPDALVVALVNARETP